MAEQQRPGKGCFFYGCLTFIILVIAVAVGTYFGTRKALKMAVDTYLDTKPATLPSVRMSATERKALVAEVTRTVEASAAGRSTEPVELPPEELNVLLREIGTLGPAAEQVYFRVETNQLKADVSIALDQFEAWRQLGKKLMISNLSGRYLNGTAFLNAQVTNGVLNLKVTDLHAKGQPLPGTFMSTLQTENLASGAGKNAQAQKILGAVDRLETREDKVYLHLKQPQQ